jgi:hypothetical protein
MPNLNEKSKQLTAIFITQCGCSKVGTVTLKHNDPTPEVVSIPLPDKTERFFQTTPINNHIIILTEIPKPSPTKS